MNRRALKIRDVTRWLPPEVVASGWSGYPGASEADLRVLEDRLGARLPPSYRAFLGVSDGWHLYPDYTLYSTSNIGWFKEQNQWLIDLWVGLGIPFAPDEKYLRYGHEAAANASRYEYLQTALQIGYADEGSYLLNPQVVTPEGEWEAWLFAPWVPGAHRYRSFEELMRYEHRNLRRTCGS